jgi:flagellin
MRINHNIASMVASGALYQSSNALNKSLEKLSTGLRINRAGDDAASLGVSEKLRAQISGLGMAKINAQNGIALLNIAEGATNEVSSVLIRMRELAVQASSDTLTSSERTYANQEFVQLRSEIDRIANNTKYGGQTLLAGSATSFGGVASPSSILHIGPNGNAGDMMTIQINTIAVTSTAATGGILLGASAITYHDGALTAIASLDVAITEVNTVRGNLGAYVNSLEVAVNNLMTMSLNNQAAESVIRDVDFAFETANFTKNQILTQSSTAMLAQANMAPQSVLALLGSR